MTDFVIPASQRRAVRRSLRLACQVVRERDFKLVAWQTLDLSPDGMLVPTDVDVEPGDEMIVSFRATPFGLWFDTDASVARVLEGRRNGDHGRCLGIRFRSLDAVARLILRGNLRRIPPPVPQREPRIDYARTLRQIQQV